MPTDNLHMQILAGRAPMADEIELLTILWVNQHAFNSSSDFPFMAETMSNHLQQL
jgi:hypothetical protein